MVGLGGSLLGKSVQKAPPGKGPTAPQAQVAPGEQAKKEVAAKPDDAQEQQHKPKFVEHLNKTRTMSAKQKWEWAFDKILQVRIND